MSLCQKVKNKATKPAAAAKAAAKGAEEKGAEEKPAAAPAAKAKARPKERSASRRVVPASGSWQIINLQLIPIAGKVRSMWAPWRRRRPLGNMWW